MTELAKVTVFYDGQCPLCVREMRHLQTLDHAERLHLVDIKQPQFNQQFPDIDAKQADRILTGINTDGRTIYGLDVTYAAWHAVGRGYWIAPLRWPGVRWFSDRVYLLFARHRARISRWVMGRSDCDSCRL
ncbi:thiol-disulfide oxidoreductase DCC [Bacterioplanes sanyensis]|uniref:Thiol-disulfide oxidoreductase DCC n=1 Tax=Bacterioplanes sanyensis TaxID=1249553 RepID=A0A222FFW3_9GAMM|nr:DUF393 domain-containing protein [Bacterioplanes sanyensis]ASP37301.1 thiol-disulfide oxidoreductase DCC [Bacterioplanes sanyensis]